MDKFLVRMEAPRPSEGGAGAGEKRARPSEDEVELVRYIKAAYAEKRSEIRALVKCLVDSGLLARRTLLLGTLVSRAAEEILANVGEAIAAAVGPSPRLRDALAPTESAFGRPRYV